MSTIDREAQRQRALLTALAAPRADASALRVRESDARAQRALLAYRSNAAAAAERALASAYPTVQAMLGDENFAQLVREHWRAVPAERGDLGEWGDALASWIATHRGLAEWPWLADVARVDWARHRCERAADGVLDAESLNRLGDTDPMQLRCVFADGFALIESRWPIAMLHRAHRTPDDEAALEAARSAIDQGLGEWVTVVRAGFRAEVAPLAAGHAAFTRALVDGATLGAAFEQAEPGFDFAAWLAHALQSAWLKGLAVGGD